MTEDDLQAIEARANAATPGPWHLAIAVDPIDGRDRDDLANIEAGAVDVAYEALNDNAAFIASARTDIPALVAEVRRLQHVADFHIKAHDLAEAKCEKYRRARMESSTRRTQRR